MLTYPRKGDVFYVAPSQYTGCELDLKDGRPGVIVSSDELNGALGTVMVVYLSKSDSSIPALKGVQFTLTSTKCSGSNVKCEQVNTVDKSRLGDYVGSISLTDLSKLRGCLLNSQDLNLPVSTTVDASQTAKDCQMKEQQYHIEELKKEVDRLSKSSDEYKIRYENLRDKCLEKFLA